jgi:hypothetical protein
MSGHHDRMEGSPVSRSLRQDNREAQARERERQAQAQEGHTPQSCPTRLMDGRNEIRCWLTAGHEGDCK